MAFTSHNSKDAFDDSPEHRILQPASENVLRQRKGSWRLFVSVVVVSLLVMTSLLLLPHNSTTSGSTIPTGKPIGPLVGTPVLAHTEVSGLETALSITPGPYFLSELLSVDITLTNHSKHSIMLEGGAALNTCNGAFSVMVTGGQEPHYDVPVTPILMSCPAGMYTLATKESLSVHGYIAITRSGAATVAMNASASTLTLNTDGTVSSQGSSPLAERWPTIAIQVTPWVPSNRLLSLQTQGNTVIVNAPDSVRPHLVYYYTVNCLHGIGTSDGWGPLKVNVLHEPYCDDAIRHWSYAVSTSGYAVAALSMDAL